MEFRAFPKISRLSREVIITEKLDGTNAQIAITAWPKCTVPPPHTVACIEAGYENLLIFAGSRNRWITPEDDNFGFAKWVKEHASELIHLGAGTHFGEWWGKGIQRGYGLDEKRFSLFNVNMWSDDTVRPPCCHVVPVLHTTPVFDTIAIDTVLANLKKLGSAAAPGYMNPEGIVIFHTASNHLYKKTFDDKPKG